MKGLNVILLIVAENEEARAKARNLSLNVGFRHVVIGRHFVDKDV